MSEETVVNAAPESTAPTLGPDRLLLRFVELKKRKRELEALVKECNAEIDKAEPALLEWFADTGKTQVRTVIGLVYLSGDLFVGPLVGDGEARDQVEERLMELLEEYEIPGAIETKISYSKLRGIIKAREEAQKKAAKAGKPLDEDVEGLPEEVLAKLKITKTDSLSVRLS